jgi:sugar/nucleoside kinase (ribokinase family)
MQLGGSGASTAIIAARLGVSTALAGVLGDDLFGRLIRDDLKAAGVGITRLKLLPGRTSPATLVYNHANGARGLAHHPGSSADFKLPEEAIRAPCRVFHIAAPEMFRRLWPGGWSEIARQLKAAGRVVSLDMSVMAGDDANSERILQEYRPLLKHADLVFPNEREARILSGKGELRTVARYFHDLGVKVVVIKRGEKGAAVCWQGRCEEVPAASVKVVDPGGAGDNFAAGFLAGYLRGLDPLNCARIGCALGALCVRFRGALAATADRSRLKRVLPGFDLDR